MTRMRFKLIPVALAVVLLCGLQVEAMLRPAPADAEPYHAAVRAVYDTMPRSFGPWVGVDAETPPAAMRLLKPNVIFSRRFTNQVTGEQVTFMLVQCKDARDINGHYPPICYPSSGMEERSRAPFDWEVDGVMFTGTEYHFESAQMSREGQVVRNDLIVDNFILIPDSPIARDMKDVGRRAWDYLQRFHGASQVQVIFTRWGDALEAEHRQQVFTEMVRAHMPILNAIRKGTPTDER